LKRQLIAAEMRKSLSASEVSSDGAYPPGRFVALRLQEIEMRPRRVPLKKLIVNRGAFSYLSRQLHPIWCWEHIIFAP
jgi:hypothetical protein